MSVEVFHGTWKIIECVNISNSRNATPAQIDGAIFVLQENGEIRWDLPPEVDHTFPLFQCDCYEVVHTFVGVCIQMGAVSGHMFEFWVDRPVPRDMMLLTFEGWCMIQCQQINAIQPPLDFPFSFLPAFTDGYFSDQALLASCSSNNTSSTGALAGAGSSLNEFKIHSVVMELSNSKMEDLEGLPSDVLETVLHFLYSQSLPFTLSTDTANRCIQLAPNKMTDFVQMCREYLHRTSLKQKIVKLVNEVHSCAEAMTSAFHENSVTSPSRFCYVIKLALRQAAVAFMKLVELCVLYGEEAPVLNRNERLEILRYAKTRLPIFLTQFVALLRNVKSDFSTVKPTDRNDIAAHVAPEIETLLDALSNLMREARDACNEIWIRWSTQHGTGSGFGFWPDGTAGSNPNMGCGGSSSGTRERETSTSDDTLTETLFSIFRKREIVKLHSVQGQVAAIYLYLAQKKENFEEMTAAVKIRCVSRNLEQLLEELPVFLLRIEEIMIAFDDRFQWKDFKFCLQLAISQVCQTVHHLRKERDRLQKFFLCLTDLVQRDEFHQSLLNLQLLGVPQSDTSSQDSGISSASPASSGSSVFEESQVESKSPANNSTATTNSSNSINANMLKNHTFGIVSDFGNNDLNLVENLCTPKKSKDSVLAQNSVKLFNSKLHSDMVFEIAQDGEKLVMPSHRVIVAARCDWFRRALLSGMKESIQKRIVIHDCSAHVFQLFLKYIYTGQIGSEVTLETLSDLIALADRYEVDALKLACEQELALRHLDENSVIFLLSMADQYNARSLRGACMEYIAANPGIMARELFEELSPELQMEVYDITMWSKPNRKVFVTPDELLSCPRYMLVPDSPSSSSSSTSSSPTFGRRHIQSGRKDGLLDDSETPIVSSSSTSRSRGNAHHHHQHHHHHHHHHSSHSHSHSHSHNNSLNNSSNSSASSTTSCSVQRAIANSILNPSHSTNSNNLHLQSPPHPQNCNSEGGVDDLEGEGDGNKETGTGGDTEVVLSQELERCLLQLRDVLGEDVPHDQLGRIALAADFDVNRALNFFFSS